MRVGIDARVMSLKASGIGRYTIEMVKSMAARSKALDHEFILYSGKDTLILDLPGNWAYSERKITSRGISRSLLYSYIARKDHLDAFYSADYLGPVLPMPCKTVITVHDLIPVVYPSVTQFRHRFVGKYLLPQCMRNASVIISVSHATQKDILKYTNVPENKIRVIYEGKNLSFHPRGQDDEAIRDIREYYKIGEKPYLLFLGTLEPKKNLFNIVKAFARLDDTTRNNSLLVLGGSAGWDNSVLETLIEELGLDGDVVFTGFVNDEHLPLLMSGAQAFCFPSLYEGFGLPVLEAMACGCPVITSNISSLPEVAGDAALLVDPHDVEQISQAMAKLLTDNKLCEELRIKVISQAEKFSWEKAAVEVLEILTTK
jgi:glycosyltransferase involved in cell wall biosynthesis